MYFTVSVNCVEHCHNPLLEGGRKVIILLALTDIFQSALKLLNSDCSILEWCVEGRELKRLVRLIIIMSLNLPYLLTLLRSAISAIWSHKSLIIMEYRVKLNHFCH